MPTKPNMVAYTMFNRTHYILCTDFEVVPPCVPTLMKLDATKLSNATMIKRISGEKTLVEGKNF